jgi:hypothetical protein
MADQLTLFWRRRLLPSDMETNHVEYFDCRRRTSGRRWTFPCVGDYRNKSSSENPVFIQWPFMVEKQDAGKAHQYFFSVLVRPAFHKTSQISTCASVTYVTPINGVWMDARTAEVAGQTKKPQHKGSRG